MRLGQLSRKLSVRSADIVDYLAKKEIKIEDSVNARVDEPALGLVLSHFAPQLNQPTLVPAVDDVAMPGESHDREEDDTRTTELPTSPDLEIADTPGSEYSEKTGENTEQEIFERQEGEAAEGDSVIRAPKVELKGLKVLGKIDLPEPKKKEEAPLNSDAEAQDSTDTKPVERPGKRYQSKQASRRTNRNPVALERERQAKEQAEKKKQEAELEKERRKQHYSKRVKVKGPTRAVRIYEDHVVMEPIPETKHETWWRKFVRWLTSY